MWLRSRRSAHVLYFHMLLSYTLLPFRLHIHWSISNPMLFVYIYAHICTQGSWVRYPVWQHTFVSPSAFSRRAVVSYWRKYVQEVLVNRLGDLSLPRKSVVRLTDRPDITLDVYRGNKTTIQQQHICACPINAGQIYFGCMNYAYRMYTYNTLFLSTVDLH